MPVDLGVFERQKTIVDQQQLQDAFELKKALAIQSAQQGELTNQIALQKLATGAEAPSAVREYQFFNKLAPDQQKQFLDVKRAAQIQNMGSGFGVYNPVQGGITPIAGGGIAPSPSQQDEITRKNRETEDQFNRGLDVKQKALEATFRLVGNPTAKAGTPEALGNVSGVRANRGGISTLFPNISNSAVDAEADLTTLSNLLTTENLGLLKGVLSDTDMKVLASIGSGEIQGSDEKAIGAIRRMQQALSGKVAAGRAVQQQGYDGQPPLLSDPKLSQPAMDPELAAELKRRGLLKQ
jgi:hypothetical protein